MPPPAFFYKGVFYTLANTEILFEYQFQEVIQEARLSKRVILDKLYLKNNDNENDKIVPLKQYFQIEWDIKGTSGNWLAFLVACQITK